MRLVKLLTFIFTITGFLASTSLVMADDAKTVLAVVNGIEITTGQISNIAGADKQFDFSALSDAKKKELVESLITRQLILEEAHKEGFDQSEKIVATVKALGDSYIVKQYLVKVAVGFDFGDAVLKEVYDQKYLNRPEQYKVSHILLNTEAEAQALVDLLNNGSDFTILAQEKSLDKVSAQKGGDLGWLTSDDMVPTFYKTVSLLNEKEVSAKPAKTQFGWHIIRLDQKRKLESFSFEKVKEDIRRDLINEKITGYIDSLKANATIEIKQ